jgi:hypothetical protein
MWYSVGLGMQTDGLLKAFECKRKIDSKPVVIPEGDLLFFVAFAIIFGVFSPKIACQVPTPPKSNKANKIGFEI